MEFVTAAEKGEAFRPTPADMARIFGDWDHRTCNRSKLDFSTSDDVGLTPCNASPYRNTAIELTGAAAVNSQRAYGYVGLLALFRKIALFGEFSEACRIYQGCEYAESVSL